MVFWWFLLLAGVASWALTGFLRRYALAKNLIDIPNEREFAFSANTSWRRYRYCGVIFGYFACSKLV